MNDMIFQERKRPEIGFREAWQIFRKTMRYLSGSKNIIILLLILLAASSVLNLTIPHLIEKSVDAIQFASAGGMARGGNLTDCLIELLLVFVLVFLLGYWQGRLGAKLTRITTLDIRKDTSEKLVRLPVSFFDIHTSGDIMSRLTNDIENISNMISQSVSAILSSLIVIVGCVVIMLLKNPLLTLICLSTVIFNVLFTLLFSKKMFGYFRVQQKTLGELNAVVEQTIPAKKTVDAYNMRDAVIRDNAQISDKLTRVGIRAQLLGGVIAPLMSLIGNLNFLFIVAAGAVMYIKGVPGITVGVIQAFALYSRQFTKPINELSMIFSQLMTALASSERVFEIIDAKPEEDYGTQEPDMADGCSVTFDHVTFSYIRGIKVLDDFSLHIEGGQKVAVVGKTGVGKTTLISLLMRFYEPDSGRILINGTDIREIPKSLLRKTVTSVLQTSPLSQGTVRDNISYGHPYLSDEEVINAAKLTRSDRFIEKLEDGYDTDLSFGECHLSGGQLQLLCLSRASVSVPKILVLDEAMSFVDVATEADIREAILKIMKNQTCIIIAHRFTTVKNSDQILVFDEGKIVETGTHDALMHQNGVYRELYGRQIQI